MSECTQIVSARTFMSFPPTELVTPSRRARTARFDGLAGINSFMFAGDDELAVVGVVEIDVVLGQEPMAARRVDLLMLGADHPQQRRLEYVRRVADRVRHFRVARGHAIE